MNFPQPPLRGAVVEVTSQSVPEMFFLRRPSKHGHHQAPLRPCRGPLYTQILLPLPPKKPQQADKQFVMSFFFVDELFVG